MSEGSTNDLKTRIVYSREELIELKELSASKAKPTFFQAPTDE
jgi:hypothetical protein